MKTWMLTYAFIFVSLIMLVWGEPGLAQPTNTQPPAQIAVSPPFYELSLDSGANRGSLKLLNMGQNPVRVTVSAYSWILDTDNQLQIVEPDEQSLVQWMIINPLQFEIPAGGFQTVRFSIRPRVKPLQGEHRAIIYFDQVLPQQEQQKLRVQFRLGVAVYGYVEEITRIAELHDVVINAGAESVQISFDISSQGNAHVRMDGHYAIWPAAAYPGLEQSAAAFPKASQPEAESTTAVIHTDTLPSFPVLPGYRRILRFTIPEALPPGEYVFDFQATLAQLVLHKAITFTVPES